MSRWFQENIDDDIAEAVVRLKIEMQTRVGQRTVDRDVRQDLAVDFELLENQLAETPSIYVYWSSILAEQRRYVSTLERMISRRKAKVSEELWNEHKKTSFKVTQYMIDELVELDDDYLRLTSEHILAKRTENKLWAIVKGIEMKSEALRSLAGFKRQEMRDLR